MDAADYVSMDSNIPIADNDINGYEVQLLADLRRIDNSTGSNHGKDQCSRNDEVDEMPEETL